MKSAEARMGSRIERGRRRVRPRALQRRCPGRTCNWLSGRPRSAPWSCHSAPALWRTAGRLSWAWPSFTKRAFALRATEQPIPPCRVRSQKPSFLQLRPSGRSALASGALCAACSPECSDVDLLCNFQRVVYLNSEVPDRAFQLAVAQQNLDRPQVLRLLVDERCLGAPHRVCPVLDCI